MEWHQVFVTGVNITGHNTTPDGDTLVMSTFYKYPNGNSGFQKLFSAVIQGKDLILMITLSK